MYIELAPTKSIRGMGRKDRRCCEGERKEVGDEGEKKSTRRSSATQSHSRARDERIIYFEVEIRRGVFSRHHKA